MTAYPATVDVTLQLACKESSEAVIPAEGEFGHWVNTALRRASGALPANACVTIRLVDTDEITHLNQRFRGMPKATNVLAFPCMPPAQAPVDEMEAELGDIVLCMDVALREAREQGKSSVAHLAHLVVHGSLHLAGLDHEEDSAADAMESLETRIMLELGFPDPYIEVSLPD